MPLDATPGAAAGSEGTTATELPPITDDRSAGAAIEGLLDLGTSGDDGDAESGASAPDAGTDENPSTDDDEEGQSETQAETPASIEPPKSWPAEDHAKFRQLPPDIQALVAKREGERDQQLLRRGEEVAEQRKAAEAERTAIQGQRQQYATSLQQLIQIAVPEAEAFAQVDWNKLANENPADYVRLNAQRDALRQRVGAVQAELQRVGQEAEAEQVTRQRTFLAEQRQRLVEKVPEFGHEIEGPKLVGEMRDWLQGQGFRAEEIGMVADHRLVSLALKAMRADKAEAARKAAELKRLNAIPTVQRPGSAAAPDAGRAKQVQAKISRLGQTNSVRDAASLLEEFLS